MFSNYLKRYSSFIELVQKHLDPAVGAVILYLLATHYEVLTPLDHLFLCLVYLIIMITFNGLKLYHSWRGASLVTETKAVFTAWFIVCGAVILTNYVIEIPLMGRRKVFLIWVIVAFASLITMRGIIRGVLLWLRSRGLNIRTVVIVGAGDLGKHVLKRIASSPEYGMTFEGFFDDRHAEGLTSCDGQKVRGTLEDVAGFVAKHKIDIVYIALPMRAVQRLTELINSLQNLRASIYIIPDIFIFDLLHTRLDDIAGMPAFAVFGTPFIGFQKYLKRAEDIVLSSVILCMVSPLMAMIAIAIKLTSPGGVFFRQSRYGLFGEMIRVLKFRTMYVCEDGDNVPQAKRNDARVTPVGAFLRRASLDELPQFLNVIRGDMSIVGPRPHAVAHNEYYRKKISGYMLRHKVKPGITGWAQINGWRGETEVLDKMHKRVECDLDYIRNWSLWLDLKIIFLTAWRGFFQQNAF